MVIHVYMAVLFWYFVKRDFTLQYRTLARHLLQGTEQHGHVYLFRLYRIV